MTTSPDMISSLGTESQLQPVQADQELDDLMSRLRANRQGIQTEGTSAAPLLTEPVTDGASPNISEALQRGGVTIVVAPAQAAPAAAAAAVQPPIETPGRRAERVRHPRNWGGIIKLTAGAALAGVVIYYGDDLIKSIENLWGDVTHAFQGQVDVKREANAALSHIQIPNRTIAVEGDGTATSTLSLGYQCPPVSLGLCNIMFPGTHDSLVPYIDSQDNMTGKDQVILDEGAWNFSAEVDKNGVPHTVIAIDTDHVSAQLASEEHTPTTDNHFTQRVANLLGLKTGNDQATKVTQDMARNVLQQSCAKPLYTALPAGIARTAHFWENQTADNLLGSGDVTGSNRLHQMAGSTVIIKFIGSEMNLNGEQVITNGVIKESGLRVDTAATENCTLSAQAMADLKDDKSKNGKTYVIEQTVPLSTKPNTTANSATQFADSGHGN